MDGEWAELIGEFVGVGRGGPEGGEDERSVGIGYFAGRMSFRLSKVGFSPAPRENSFSIFVRETGTTVFRRILLVFFFVSSLIQRNCFLAP